MLNCLTIRTHSYNHILEFWHIHFLSFYSPTQSGVECLLLYPGQVQIVFSIHLKSEENAPPPPLCVFCIPPVPKRQGECLTETSGRTKTTTIENTCGIIFLVPIYSWTFLLSKYSKCFRFLPTPTYFRTKSVNFAW